MLVKGKFGNKKLHDHILYRCLFPHLEKIVANSNSGVPYTLSQETKIYQDGRIVTNPDIIIQTPHKDLIFEVKSSREENAWLGAIKQCRDCVSFYLEHFKDLNYYIARPKEGATSIKSVHDLELSLLHQQGEELLIEDRIL